MDLIVTEILLWIGLFCLFWAMKDGLSKVEADIEENSRSHRRMAMQAGSRRPRFDQAEKLFEPIGRYLDVPIFRYAVIDGSYYRFDRVCPSDSALAANDEECCISPGLVYVRMQAQEVPALQA